MDSSKPEPSNAWNIRSASAGLRLLSCPPLRGAMMLEAFERLGVIAPVTAAGLSWINPCPGRRRRSSLLLRARDRAAPGTGARLRRRSGCS